MGTIMDRIAGAPITWGVDGSPGWGYTMDRDRVLSEMVEIGLTATELGPDGYLPRDPDELARHLDTFGLRIVGGFVPAVLYRPDLVDEQLQYVEHASTQLASTGSKVMVLGPDSHLDGYDTSIEMDEEEWSTFLENLEKVRTIASEHDLQTALHQHWGMAIERPSHVHRLLESCDVGLCLDTGHLFIGGADPVEIAKLATGRTHHVHLKDADADLAERVREGDMGFRQAVIDGMFQALGEGDIDIADVIQQLESTGYDGWYVLEQDAVVHEVPEKGAGPKEDAEKSLAYLRELAATL
ncbi:MAG: TIM barrel protein [Egibacteraceae bacterium]